MPLHLNEMPFGNGIANRLEFVNNPDLTTIKPLTHVNEILPKILDVIPSILL